jgi:hypothetical protein
LKKSGKFEEISPIHGSNYNASQRGRNPLLRILIAMGLPIRETQSTGHELKKGAVIGGRE